MPTVTLLLRGDQIGTFTGLSGTGNGPDRVVTLTAVEALGPTDVFYTVTVEQVNDGVTEFQNGQFVTITDAAGNIVMPRTNIQPDAEQGLGAGDEHLIVSGPNVLIDLGGVPPGPTTVQYTNADENGGPTGDDDGNLDFTDFPCLTPGTMVATPAGPRNVVDLAAGDVLVTANRDLVRIAWVGRRALDLRNRPSGAKPVLVREGALGPGMPDSDTVLSPDHRVMLADDAAALLFDQREVLVPSKALTGFPRVRDMAGRKRVQYITVFTDRHAVIYANRMPVETLYPGPMALRRLGVLGRASLFNACPYLETGDVAASHPPARPMLTVAEARCLVSTMRTRDRLRGRTDAPPTAPGLRIVGKRA